MIKLSLKFILLLSLFSCSLLLLQNCNKDSDDDAPDVTPTSLSAISTITIMDIGDAENGTDLQIAFSKVSDESNVKEYRIFVVNSAESSSFDLDKAAAVSSNNFTTVSKTGNNFSTTLAANARTTSGDLIANDAPYRIFVMTVTNDPLLFLNALSSASSELTLTTDIIVTGDEVKVTYIANDGVMIEFEDKKVVIDAINRTSNLGGWISPSSLALSAVENGNAPYDDIDVIMITHNHGDHYSTTAVQNYLSNHPNTKLIAPHSVRRSFTSFASQTVDIAINKFERVNVVENDISIDVLRVEHFDQFGNNFDTVQSFTYVVHLGDKAFLHAGDIDYVDSQLDVFNLLQDSITVAFIPTFGNLVNAANRDALISNVDPKNIVCLHLLSSSLTTTLGQINTIYPGADVFRTPFETRLY